MLMIKLTVNMKCFEILDLLGVDYYHYINRKHEMF